MMWYRSYTCFPENLAWVELYLILLVGTTPKSTLNYNASLSFCLFRFLVDMRAFRDWSNVQFELLLLLLWYGYFSWRSGPGSSLTCLLCHSVALMEAPSFDIFEFILQRKWPPDSMLKFFDAAFGLCAAQDLPTGFAPVLNLHFSAYAVDAALQLIGLQGHPACRPRLTPIHNFIELLQWCPSCPSIRGLVLPADLGWISFTLFRKAQSHNAAQRIAVVPLGSDFSSPCYL